MKSWLEGQKLSKAEYILSIILVSAIAFHLGAMVSLRTGLWGSIVHGDSMCPSITDGARVLSVEAGSREIRRGDIVSINLIFVPGQQGNALKRVVALPGEHIRIEGNQVFINGEILAEPYAWYQETSYIVMEQRLQANQYFVMGDNRLGSTDSRKVGPVSRDVIERVVIRVRQAGDKD